MYLATAQTRALGDVMRLLAEATDPDALRGDLALPMLDLLRADTYVSFTWDRIAQRFDRVKALNMSLENLRSWDEYYRFVDPLTFPMMARRHPTLATQILCQSDLARTEFFNDFLARDGLHWGVNAYSYVGDHNIGDVRIWRSRKRGNFDTHTLGLLRLIEPAFTAALVRADGGAGETISTPSPVLRLSVRELEIARMIADDLSDKEIAGRLGVEVSTVRTHIKRVFAKLGVRRRSGVASLFARWR